MYLCPNDWLLGNKVRLSTGKKLSSQCDSRVTLHMNAQWFRNCSAIHWNILQFQQFSSLISGKHSLQIGFLWNSDESSPASHADHRASIPVKVTRIQTNVLKYEEIFLAEIGDLLLLWNAKTCRGKGLQLPEYEPHASWEGTVKWPIAFVASPPFSLIRN